MNRAAVEVIDVHSPGERAAAYEIRREVFQREQHVAEEEEFDADDERAWHVLARVGGEAVGTGRVVIYPDYAKIGRMAVRRRFRRGGVGRAILNRLMDVARRQGAGRFLLHAQVQAMPFYESAGFEAFGPVFDEAGIPHRKMQRAAA